MRDVKEPEVRRIEIMDAALNLFVKKGYLKTTTQDIIEQANISRGLLYYHFKDKEDLLYCLIERYSEPMLQCLSNITYKETNAIEKLRLFIDATLISPDAITSNMIVLQETIDLEQNRYLMDRFAHKLCSIITTYFCHIIKQGIVEGEFYVEAPLETASFLMNGYVFTSIETTALPDKKKKQYLDAYKELLIRALGMKENIFNK